LAARRPGGSIWYRLREPGGGLIVAVGLSAFFPRLPRCVFRMVEAPLHRATIRRAIGDLAAGLQSTPGSE
jgi:hypothetical protein